MKINEMSPRRFWALTLGWLVAGIGFYAGARWGLLVCLGVGALAGVVLGPTLDRMRKE